MRSVLVTGAAGFIGRRLCAAFEAHGARASAWQGDVRDRDAAQPAADLVVHLAAIWRHQAIVADPRTALEVNLIGTQNVIEHCARTGARLVLASTSALYRGTERAEPLSEDAPIETVRPYALNKWLAEELCRAATRRRIDVAILRLFNVYGPDQHEAFLIPQIMHALARGEAPRIRMPDAYRDLVFVDDAVDAFLAAAAWGGAGARVFNIGSRTGVRVRELVDVIARRLQVPARLAPAEPRDGEQVAVIADTTRARLELGWAPRVSLDEGLTAVVQAVTSTRV